MSCDSCGGLGGGEYADGRESVCWDCDGEGRWDVEVTDEKETDHV